MNGVIISSTTLSDNTALLGKKEQFGKLAKSICYKPTHYNTLPAFLIEKIGLSFSVHIISI